MGKEYQSIYFIYTTTDAVKCILKNYLAIFTDKKNNTIKTIDNIQTNKQFYEAVNLVADHISGFVVKNDSAKFF